MGISSSPSTVLTATLAHFDTENAFARPSAKRAVASRTFNGHAYAVIKPDLPKIAIAVTFPGILKALSAIANSESCFPN